MLESHTTYLPFPTALCHATVLTAKAPRIPSLPVASSASMLLIVFCQFSSDTFFDLIGRGRRRVSSSSSSFLLKVGFLYGVIIKTATDFSCLLHTHPISLILQDGASCLSGWVGLLIGTGLASSSKNTGGPCGRVSKPPLEATYRGSVIGYQACKKQNLLLENMRIEQANSTFPETVNCCWWGNSCDKCLST